MSKEKPEGGDVWEDAFLKYYILSSDDTTTECCFISGNRKARVANFLTNRIIRDWKYFGKSKANINDLFEVEQ